VNASQIDIVLVVVLSCQAMFNKSSEENKTVRKSCTAEATMIECAGSEYVKATFLRRRSSAAPIFSDPAPLPKMD
jgi:hypothetical protein